MFPSGGPLGPHGTVSVEWAEDDGLTEQVQWILKQAGQAWTAWFFTLKHGERSMKCAGFHHYPLVNVLQKNELWKITMFHGNIHYFYGHFFDSYFDITRGYLKWWSGHHGFFDEQIVTCDLEDSSDWMDWNWAPEIGHLPSGNLLRSYWKWPIEIVDLPIKHGDFQ